MSYVYVAGISGHPDICKIGASGHPAQRISSLCNKYGVDFWLCKTFKAGNHFGLEKKIHERLKDMTAKNMPEWADSENREIFDISPLDASLMIENIMRPVVIDYESKDVDFASIVLDITQDISFPCLWASLKNIDEACVAGVDTLRRIANGSTTKVEYHIGCGLLEIHKGVLRRKCK